MGIDNSNPPRDLSQRETLARIKFPNLKVIRMELIEKTLQRLVIVVVDIEASVCTEDFFIMHGKKEQTYFLEANAYLPAVAFHLMSYPSLYNTCLI